MKRTRFVAFPKVHDYLTKPFSLAELEVRVGAILPADCHCRKATSDFEKLVIVERREVTLNHEQYL